MSGRGQYDRAAARARREALAAGRGADVAQDHPEPLTEPVSILPVVQHPSRIRLLEAHGFVDDIGAVYGPKLIGYETSNPREIAVLLARGVRHEVVS